MKLAESQDLAGRIASLFQTCISNVDSIYKELT